LVVTREYMEGVQERGISLNDVLDYCRLLSCVSGDRNGRRVASSYCGGILLHLTSCVCSSGPTASVAPPGSLRIVPPHQRISGSPPVFSSRSAERGGVPRGVDDLLKDDRFGRLALLPSCPVVVPTPRQRRDDDGAASICRGARESCPFHPATIMRGEAWIATCGSGSCGRCTTIWASVACWIADAR
jgi:hypothetical protein